MEVADSDKRTMAYHTKVEITIVHRFYNTILCSEKNELKNVLFEKKLY